MKNIYTLIFVFSSFVSFSQTTLLSEDFTNGIPSNWTVLNTGVCNGWHSETNFPTSLVSGEVALAWSYATLNGGCQSETALRSPMIDASNYTTAILTFDHDIKPFSLDTGDVYYSYDGGINWNLLQKFTQYTNGTVSLPLSPISNNMLISFNHYGYDGNFWAIDNILISVDGGVAVSSWNCINGDCIDPSDGSGNYNSLTTCQSVCNSTGLSEKANKNIKLLKVIDLLGREVDYNVLTDQTTLIYIYNDGTVDKKTIIK